MLIPLKIGENLTIYGFADLTPDQCREHVANAARALGWGVGQSRDGKFLISASYGSNVGVAALRAFIGVLAEPTYITFVFDKRSGSVPGRTSIEACVHISRLGSISDTFASTLRTVLRAINAQMVQDGVRPDWHYLDLKGMEAAILAARKANREVAFSDVNQFLKDIDVAE